MTLNEFLQYKDKCPVCGYKLGTFLHSEKQQKMKFENDRVVFEFRMDPLKRKQVAYQVGYSFGIEDNSWQLEIYRDGFRIESYFTTDLLNRFKQLDSNLGAFKFYKRCNSSFCGCFNYSSNKFKVKYNGTLLFLENDNSLFVKTEYVGIADQLPNPHSMGAMVETREYKIYKILNDYKTQSTNLIFGRCKNEEIARADWGIYNPPIDSLEMIMLPLIKITPKNELVERLNKLITFS